MARKVTSKGTSNVVLRTATIEDLPTLLQFEQGVVSAERALVSSMVQTGEVTYYNLPALITAHTQALVLIAELSGVAIGCGLTKILPNKEFYSEKLKGYIGLIYVLPKYRRRGVSRFILDSLVDWLRLKEVKDIRLDVFSNNHQALAAYQKIGFSPLLIEMQLQLD